MAMWLKTPSTSDTRISYILWRAFVYTVERRRDVRKCLLYHVAHMAYLISASSLSLEANCRLSRIIRPVRPSAAIWLSPFQVPPSLATWPCRSKQLYASYERASLHCIS
ncbi:hypothetical protein ABW21_db0207895 [Orbilia brochopaga]|nr:hypothetical protein ABW21_db0207895 [Drechslerella brochopaga]